MSTPRTTPGPGFWAAIAAIVVLGYPVALGPACWLSSRCGGKVVVTKVYRPLTASVEYVDVDALDKSLHWYSELFAVNGWYWIRTSNDSHLRRGDAEWRWERFLAMSSP